MDDHYLRIVFEIIISFKYFPSKAQNPVPKKELLKTQRFGPENPVTLNTIKNVSLPNFVQLSWPNLQFLRHALAQLILGMLIPRKCAHLFGDIRKKV